MNWTLGGATPVNHHPVAIVNGIGGTAPILLDAEVGKPLTIDAGQSHDTDKGQRLHYRWFHYPEAGFVPEQGMAAITIDGANSSRATVTPTATCRPQWLWIGVQ
ncbi:hypothetical protein, partial [Sphingobium sp. Z007]